MNKKLPQSRIIAISKKDSQKKTQKYQANNKQPLCSFSHAQQAQFPLKLGNVRHRKEANINMHTETIQNPEKLSIKTKGEVSNSRIFKDQIETKADHLANKKHPQHLFYSKEYIPQLKKGIFSKIEHPYTYQAQKTNATVSIAQNTSLFTKKQTYESRNPILSGQQLGKTTSAKNIWQQQRRIRDNGQKCSQALQWSTKIPKRYPYQSTTPIESTLRSYRSSGILPNLD